MEIILNVAMFLKPFNSSTSSCQYQLHTEYIVPTSVCLFNFATPCLFLLFFMLSNLIKTTLSKSVQWRMKHRELNGNVKHLWPFFNHDQDAQAKLGASRIHQSLNHSWKSWSKYFHQYPKLSKGQTQTQTLSSPLMTY